MGKLDVCAVEAPQGTVVKIAGEVTVEEVDELERRLQALTALKTPIFVLDLSGLAFAASLAISCLLRFRNQIMSAGGRVALAEIQPMVHQSFRHAQLHRVFSIYDTVDEALGRTAVT